MAKFKYYRNKQYMFVDNSKSDGVVIRIIQNAVNNALKNYVNVINLDIVYLSILMSLKEDEYNPRRKHGINSVIKRNNKYSLLYDDYLKTNIKDEYIENQMTSYLYAIFEYKNYKRM